MILIHDKKPTFLVDAMLGNIAKKLRMMGYDTSYSSDIDDEKLIMEAKKENRIIISKDEQLSRIAEKQNIPLIRLKRNTEVEQFIEINKKLKLEKFKINAKNSRCPICNGKLNSINPDLFPGKIPKGVLENSKNFWMCDYCKKIYWEGTHIINLQKFVGEINEKL